MAKKASSTPEQKQLRIASRLLIGAVAGLLVTFVSGFALVPRVRLVEVLITIASAVGAGAALTGAVVQYRQARDAVRRKP